MLMYGLQWFAVIIPFIVIMGLVASRPHYPALADQIFYIQKLLALLGALTVAQMLIGHRLPMVTGPATILLIGLVSEAAPGMNSLYTAMLIGGGLLAVAGMSGIIGRLHAFFTTRIIAVILVLIAFTLTPTIIDLMLPAKSNGVFNLSFGLLLALALIIINHLMRGIGKALTFILGLVGGSLIYFILDGFPAGLPDPGTTGRSASLFLDSLDFHAGAILSFIFCYLALTINELGSVEALGHLLQVRDMPQRIKLGSAMQGLANMSAGGMGVIGSVDYAISAGLIGATGCASRYTLIPAGLGLVACAFLPQAVLLFFLIPNPVMGALLLYLMASQLATGLALLVAKKGIDTFNHGLIVALPLMFGLIIAFVPKDIFLAFPETLRPIVGNGFVMGTLAVLLLEHVILRQKSAPAPSASAPSAPEDRTD